MRGCIGAFVDITERKQAEEALAERKDWLELAMGAASIGAWHWDIVEDKRVFDNQVCRLLGIESATFTGSSEEFFRTVHPEDVAMLKDALALTVQDQAAYGLSIVPCGRTGPSVRSSLKAVWSAMTRGGRRGSSVFSSTSPSASRPRMRCARPTLAS